MSFFEICSNYFIFWLLVSFLYTDITNLKWKCPHSNSNVFNFYSQLNFIFNYLSNQLKSIKCIFYKAYSLISMDYLLHCPIHLQFCIICCCFGIYLHVLCFMLLTEATSALVTPSWRGWASAEVLLQITSCSPHGCAKTFLSWIGPKLIIIFWTKEKLSRIVTHVRDNRLGPKSGTSDGIGHQSSETPTDKVGLLSPGKHFQNWLFFYEFIVAQIVYLISVTTGLPENSVYSASARLEAKREEGHSVLMLI